MKNKIIVLGIAAIIVFANLLFTNSGCSSPTTTMDATANGISNKFAVLPMDIVAQSQKVADTFSWQSFIAMNWPANITTCGPDTSNGSTILTGKGPVVWETYLSSDQVFVASPDAPSPWCSNNNAVTSLTHLPQKVQDLARKTGVYRFVHRISKSPHALDQAVGGPLVDQNGRFARYEVRMNYDEYNFITKNNLWNIAGQNKYAADSTTITMPAGPSAYGANGAMEFKAAWKVLGKGDDTNKFYKIKAIVYNDDSGDPSPGENPVTLGLVGLHIAHKTALQRNWVWSTFEQVDNLTKSFYNANCDTCTPNLPIPGSNYKELNPDGSPINKPTQVKRVNAVEDPFADSINLYFQSLLKGSVWANYKLVSTQWLFAETMTPSFLANSVQETYVQGPHPASYGGFHLNIDQPYYTDSLYQPFAKGISSSCMGCHYVATFPAAPARTDFSFIYGEAH
ncbi:hypothetical protein [Ferruginibacter sp. SUN106]|uniref:hypothetical protein n=1 Tax=Ferruginibacter sp. SUN106 TaxID=2978348 RepID=UPI003D367F96